MEETNSPCLRYNRNDLHYLERTRGSTTFGQEDRFSLSNPKLSKTTKVNC